MKTLILTLALTLSTLINVAQTPPPTLTVKHYLTTTTTSTILSDTGTVLTNKNIIKAVVGDSIIIYGVVDYFWDPVYYTEYFTNNTQLTGNITHSNILSLLINDTTYKYLLGGTSGHGNLINIFIDTTTTSSTGIKTVNHTVTELSVYPNPVVDYVTVTYNTTERNSVINVYDVAGSLVMSDKAEREIGHNETKVNMSELMSGIYFVKVGTATFKVVK